MCDVISSYIALGSNLQNPQDQIMRAIMAMNVLPMCRVIKISRLYRSVPWNNMVQPMYYNAVVLLKTRLSAIELLALLQRIEDDQGRHRDKLWGARTLDLDLLLYGSYILNTERLTLPHRWLHLRNFVVYPLADIGNVYIPSLKKLIFEVRAYLDHEGLWVEASTRWYALSARMTQSNNEKIYKSKR